MRFLSAGTTHVGLKRQHNEDALLDARERALWVVADGMGGHEAGDVAAKMVVDRLAQELSEGSVEDRLEKASAILEEVNGDLVTMAQGGAKSGTIGTTVVGLVIDEAQFGIFWAGDSRAYRVRDGAIAQLTRDHSLVQDLVEAGMLAFEDAEHHPDANVVTRAVGAKEMLKVATRTGDTRSGDIFVIASDGLTKVVEKFEILDIVTSRNPMQSVDALLEMTLQRGAPDNVTIQVIRVG
ncbi:MAG: serine/threonine-protein phosphatase [Sphingomonas sp.]|nr:serine/threonine-protein phosphatase [Sphingomonas sp.]